MTKPETQPAPKPKLLTKDEILGVEDRETREVDVLEWGGMVVVATMDAATRDEFEQETRADSETPERRNFRARVVQKCMVDPGTLEPMFSLEEVDRLGKKSSLAMLRVFTAAADLNAMTKDSLERFEKNSGATGRSASASN